MRAVPPASVLPRAARPLVRLAFAVAMTAALLAVSAGAALAAEIRLTPEGFEPERVTVPAGETLVWVNASGRERRIVAADGSWDSGPLADGETFSVALREPGTVVYRTQDNQASGVVVLAAPSGTASPTPGPAAGGGAGGDATPSPSPSPTGSGAPQQVADTGAPASTAAAVAAALLGLGVLLVRRRVA